ncbi:hypothetical protein SAMD00023353_0403460 [Rosellinia necatrix]|uniref:Uncharacterized protein n=1 Tax=Rosellinia necatrix TaxID=77044 RepID=A0A1S7ULK8_ROSNE|nr:hypothetical protein SAMD00023353_0403460 [Rosellinia necatrix]
MEHQFLQHPPSDVDGLADLFLEQIEPVLRELFGSEAAKIAGLFRQEFAMFISLHHLSTQRQELAYHHYYHSVSQASNAIQHQPQGSTYRLPDRTLGDIPQREDTLSYQLTPKEKCRKLIDVSNNLHNYLTKSTRHAHDREVKYLFSRLRNSIRKLVLSTFEDEAPSEEYSANNEPFFKSLRSERRQVKSLPNWVRSKVFLQVHERILSKPDYPSKWGSSLEELETALLANIPSGNLKLQHFVDWRSASMRCAKSLQNDHGAGHKDSAAGQSDLISSTVDYIWEFLRPLKIKRDSSEANGLRLLKTVCSEAYSLTRLMQGARDVFEIMIDCGNHKPEDIVEIEDNEGAGPSMYHSDIAFWTFGALTKRTYENPKISKILQKGQAVIW